MQRELSFLVTPFLDKVAKFAKEYFAYEIKYALFGRMSMFTYVKMIIKMPTPAPAPAQPSSTRHSGGIAKRSLSR
jgi:hypothetical protein